MAEPTNITEFVIGLHEFIGHYMLKDVKRVRDTFATQAVEWVMLLTPVKTGRMKGNWQTTVNEPAEGYDPDKYDKTGQQTTQAALSVIAKARPYEPIWLHNGVPYAVHVDQGTAHHEAIHIVERTGLSLKAYINWGIP